MGAVTALFVQAASLEDGLCYFLFRCAQRPHARAASEKLLKRASVHLVCISVVVLYCWPTMAFGQRSGRGLSVVKSAVVVNYYVQMALLSRWQSRLSAPRICGVLFVDVVRQLDVMCCDPLIDNEP